jgi:hypothetical protein
MLHLDRLLRSTKLQICFISKTRNSKFSRTALINRFNIKDAYIVLPQGLSGGLWLMWDQDIALSAEFSSSNLILASCTYVNTTVKFGLICMYGDPHHQNSTSVWATVRAFVVKHLGCLCYAWVI